MVACTTSPADTGTTRRRAEHEEAAALVDPGRLADERLAGRGGRPVPRGRRWRTRRRTPRGAPPARRAGTRRTRSAGCAAAPTSRSVRSTLDPLERQRRGAVVGQLLPRQADVDADAGDHGRAGRGVDPLGEDAGELAVVQEHVVGPLEARPRRRAGAGRARRRTRSAAGATASPPAAPSGRAAPTGSARTAPASPTCGPGGRGRRSGARPPPPGPRRPLRRGRARRRGRWSTGRPRRPPRTSRPG